ncbi:MAG: hypothetical protein RL497_1591, partial [Pseudomonadota bacterium]
GGCHQPGTFGISAPNAVGPGQSWPNSDLGGFVHVNENPVNGIFRLSPALTQVFLPARKADLESFLGASTRIIEPPILVLPGITLPLKPVPLPKIDVQKMNLDEVQVTPVRSKRAG